MQYATYEDLVEYYGQELIDKISSKTVYDEDLQEYVSQDDPLARQELVEKALMDGAQIITREIAKCFDLKKVKAVLDSGDEFPVLKILNMRYAIGLLKDGGDCEDCLKCKVEIKDLCCLPLISDDGEVIENTKTIISVTPNKDCWDTDTACCWICKNSCCTCCGD